MKPLLTARDLISFVAFVVTAAEFTYWLGGRTRQAIDNASDTLAALWAISWGVGEQAHYEALSEAIDAAIAAFAPRPAEMLPVMAVAAPSAPPAPPAPSAPPKPRKPRPARRRRSPAKTQD
jgi:hypothetical protein